MEQIYRRHMGSVKERAAQAEPPSGQPGAAAAAPFKRYQEANLEDIEARFARLPNPDLVMYVAPHLSPNGRYPIPGYSTVFPLYESVEYAMPGEAHWHRMTAQPPRAAEAATQRAAGGATAPQRKPARHVAKD
jgi:conjugative transfer region lipoprotein (TIGR03751 family)